VLLRAAGFKIQPPGAYRIRLELRLYTQRADIDGAVKIVQDTVCEALGIDDRAVDELRVCKQVVRRRAEQRMETCAVLSLADPSTGPSALRPRAGARRRPVAGRTGGRT
jgi:hypothetical protein